MSGSLRHAWDYFAGDLWEPLANFSSKDAGAPPDLFSDLFATADEFLSPHPTDMELEEARNNPDKARQRFIALKGTDFANESNIVQFLEEARNVIADYEIAGFEDHYRRLIRDVMAKFNLRYRLDDPFILRFLLPGSFNNLYNELHRLNTSNGHLASLWTDFEEAFDLYARTQSDSNLRVSIAKASNYLEGVASATHGNAGTLGSLCDQLTDWPHDKVKEAVKNLYGFCSDYPGIRHAGNPRNQRRPLDRRDSVSINVSLLALASYLCTGFDEGLMLGAGPGGSSSSLTRPSTITTPGKGNGWLSRMLRTVGLSRA